MSGQPRWMQAGFGSRGAGPGPDRSGRTHRAAAAAEAHLRQRRYIRHVPWDLRLWSYLAGWLASPRDFRTGELTWWRLRRLRRGLVWAYPAARELLAALAGGRVSEAEYLERRAICETCPAQRIRLPRSPRGRFRYYCSACGCPDWPGSELAFKARLRRARCLRKLWARPPDWVDGWIAAREAALTLRALDGDGNGLEIDDRNLERGGELDERRAGRDESREVVRP